MRLDHLLSKERLKCPVLALVVGVGVCRRPVAWTKSFTAGAHGWNIDGMVPAGLVVGVWWVSTAVMVPALCGGVGVWKVCWCPAVVGVLCWHTIGF